MRLGALLIFAALCSTSVDSLSQPAPSMLDGLRLAAPLRIDGPIPVHYSPGAEARARALRERLTQASAFYAEQFGVSPTYTLAVLDPPAWKAVTNLPYGMPFVQVQERVMVLPFRQEGAVADAIMAHASKLPDAVVKAVDTSGRPFIAHVAEMVDLIGYHELGHLYVRELGIDAQNRWFNEMLATYLAYAFIAERLPNLTTTWRIVTAADSQTTPTYRSLEDFERLYSGVGADNYNWYQGRFSDRVLEVFPAARLEFIRKVRDAFPRQANEKLTPEQVLNRVEKIHPGFKAWADSLATPKP